MLKFSLAVATRLNGSFYVLSHLTEDIFRAFVHPPAAGDAPAAAEHPAHGGSQAGSKAGSRPATAGGSPGEEGGEGEVAHGEERCADGPFPLAPGKRKQTELAFSRRRFMVCQNQSLTPPRSSRPTGLPATRTPPATPPRPPPGITSTRQPPARSPQAAQARTLCTVSAFTPRVSPQRTESFTRAVPSSLRSRRRRRDGGLPPGNRRRGPRVAAPRR